MRKERVDILFLMSICAIMVGFGVAIFVLPPKSFSQKENRTLDQMPSPELSSILSGSFFRELNGFYQDQFPLRDRFTELYALCEKRLGKIETNGVITTSDGLCIALPSSTNTSKIQKNLDAISSLKEERELYLYAPPSSFDVFNDRLPSIYPKEAKVSAPELLEGDALEDFLELCSVANEEYYYKTDHHWTAKGAYFAYTQICNRMGIEPYGESYFVKEEVANDFLGTSASKSGLPSWLMSEDTVTLYRYDGDKNVTVHNRETNEIKNGFYSYDALEETDKYKVFLGGNYSHLSIHTVQERPKLLLIKDSFANSVIPFLALHFDIEVIDPRYCSNEYLNTQLEREDIDKTLILMGLDTLTINIFN